MMTPDLPERIGRLNELANNMWWSWHEEARSVFRVLDYPLWRISGHNPVKVLREVSPDVLQAAVTNPSFLELYDSVMSNLDADLSEQGSSLVTECPSLLSGPTAYFSMEYAIHNSLPIYAGGLGILAGDICKEMSDLGIPMVAVGFMYPQGYFHQHVGADGWQQEIYHKLNFEEAPVNPVLSAEGKNSLTRVQLGGINLAIGAWLVKVGRTDIYLLDTNLEENPPQYRELVSRLYVADPELRLQQEIVLGIGGVRVLRALNINPVIWHANEGHTAFMMLERIREEVQAGKSFNDAVNNVQSATVFTTHTPIKAGHDVFPSQLIEKYFCDYWQDIGIDREKFFQLGQYAGYEPQSFNMTASALRTAGQRSAVSRLHEKVTRRMWRGLWPDVPEEQVPISHVTNGVHVPSWIAPMMANLFAEYMGADWVKKHDAPELWNHILDIPDDKIWNVHLRLKRKLGTAIRERMRERWAEDKISLQQMIALGALLDPEALTVAFVRRLAEYKRPTLLFRDIERLKQMSVNELYPVHILFAGKSHPADLASKRVLQQVYNVAADPAFKGRIIFVEDYDMHIARYLVQGVDVWLNTPRRWQEASGTSGMKAALNGVLHLSVRDGWWHEAYNGSNGWTIGGEFPAGRLEEEDKADAESLYRLLEEKIIPLYYSQDRYGVPHDWVSLMKESIRSIAPAFSARRMLKEYIEKMYRPAARSLKGI
ncbi:alpha-glucan family phosphorylase [Chloroflexota bacterium]